MTLALTIRTKGFIASPVSRGWGRRATGRIEQTMFHCAQAQI
jgi:hypothetical protein